MPYTNTIVTTSTSGTWNGTSLSYSTISLIDGIPHSAQLEVERIFTVPRDTTNYATIEDFLNNSATTQKDKQQVFVIPASRITFNETAKTITAIDLPSSGNTYDYDPDGAGLANVPVPTIVSGIAGVGDVIKVRRKTVSNQTLVEWSAGSKLTSAQLNLEVKQLLYLIQELVDKTTTEVNVSNETIGTVTNYSITPVKLSTGGPIWDSSSRLGINMTPTTRMLSVYNSSFPSIQLCNSTTGATANDGSLISVSGSNLFITNQESGSLTLGTDNKGRLNIDSTGNVSVGSVNAAGNANRTFDVYNLSTGASAASSISLVTIDAAGGINSSTGQLIKHQTGSLMLQNTDTNAAAHIRFAVGNSERMRIKLDGSVGIGTASPTGKLHVVGNTKVTSGTAGGVQSDITNMSGIHLDGGISASSTSSILYSSGGGGGAAMSFYRNDAYLTGIALSTNNASSANTTTERMRIDPNGNVGIGTGGPSYTLDVVGTGRFANAANANKLLIEGYGNALAYGIQFTPANNTSTFPCRFLNAAGTLVGSIQTDANTTIFNGTVNGSVMGNIGTTIVVTLPAYATALAATAASGFCSKPAASNVVTLPNGTWIGYAVNMSAAGVISAIANIPATSGAITCTGLSSGSTNLVNLVLMRSA